MAQEVKAEEVAAVVHVRRRVVISDSLSTFGKADGFYPGEVMQFVNKNVHGKQAVGHIDLLAKQSYIEVPEQDAQKVMQSLDGATYKGRKVRCNDAEEGWTWS